MTKHQLINVLLSSPEDDDGMALSGDWEMPIFDALRVRMAIAHFHRYRFPSPQLRRTAAKRIAEKAVEFGIAGPGLSLIPA